MPELSKEVKIELAALQEQLKVYLKRFTKLEKGSEDYQKNLAQGKKVQALYLQLSLMDLTVNAAANQEDTQAVDSENLTKKEARKARRQQRKKERKAARNKRREKRSEMRVERRKQRNDKSGVLEEASFRFDQVQQLYEILNVDKITSNFRDYLDEAESLLQKAKNFIAFAAVYAPNQFLDEIEKVNSFIEKIEKFLAVARNISHQIDVYGNLAKEVVAATLDIPNSIDKINEGVISNAQKVLSKAKAFIAAADTSDETLKLNVEKLQEYIQRGQEKLIELESFVGLALEDEDGNELPDWYDKIAQQYEALIGGQTDLIPGTNIDDKILLQISALKSSIEKGLKTLMNKAQDADIQEKIKNLESWLAVLNKFISAVTGFVQNIKEGDLVEIYSNLKDFKALIDSDKDLLEGTQIDDTIKAKLKEYSSKAHTWLMNTLTGGDPNKEQEVKEILGLIDQLILSSGSIPDHSKMFADDDNQIKIPELTDVSATQIDAVLEKYGISKKNASYEGILSDMKDNTEAVKDKITAKYKDALKRGAEASLAFKTAKDDFENAVEKHQNYFRASNSIGLAILEGLFSVTGLAVNTFAPGGGAVVTAIGKALTGDFEDLNAEIDTIIPDHLEFIGDLTKDILPAILPEVGSTKGDIQLEGKEMMQGLQTLYTNGVTVRYQEVLGLLSSVRGNAKVVGKNLRKVENAETINDEDLKKVHKKVIILEIKWSSLLDEIMAKYVNIDYPPIKRNNAIHIASRYLCSSWLIKFPKKEIRIGNSMIDLFNNYGVMSEAKAEWETGFWATAGRSFFGFFGSDPFDYRKELNKLKKWASAEHDVLKTTQAWSKAF